MSGAPDYAEPLVGWRAWLVVRTAEGARLASVVYRTRWEPGAELAAACENRPRLLTFWRRRGHPRHEAPSASCTCGIYAADTPAAAASYLGALGRVSLSALHRVIGLVSLWGTVVECETGWRAARAYPRRLYVPTHRSDGRAEPAAGTIALDLASYGVPVELVDAGTAEEVVAVVAELTTVGGRL